MTTNVDPAAIEVPFLYRRTLGWISRTRTTLRRLLVFGGRGMGKSTLLKKLRDHMRKSSLEPCYIRGADPDAAQRLISWAGKPGQPLLIDNLDECFGPDVEAALRGLSEEGTGVGRIVATSRTPYQPLNEKGVFEQDPVNRRRESWEGSTSLSTFCVEWMDPWSPPELWESDMLGAIQIALEAGLRALPTASGDAGRARPTSGELASWLVDFSGGHPWIVGRAFLRLIQLIEGGPELAEVGPRLQAGVEEGLGGALQNHAAFAVAWLATEDADALAELKDLVAGKDISDRSGLIRRAGLARWDTATQSLALVAEVLREPLIQALTTLQAKEGARKETAPELKTAELRAPELVPDSSRPEAAGTLRFHREGRWSTVPLKGSAWRLIRLLAEAGGKPVPLEVITEKSGASSPAAARSVIQRLRERLDRAGFAELVVNVAKRGYALSEDVLLPPLPRSDADSQRR